MKALTHLHVSKLLMYIYLLATGSLILQFGSAYGDTFLPSMLDTSSSVMKFSIPFHFLGTNKLIILTILWCESTLIGKHPWNSFFQYFICGLYSKTIHQFAESSHCCVLGWWRYQTFRKYIFSGQLNMLTIFLKYKVCCQLHFSWPALTLF